LIGRAAQGQPWIFREVAHYLATGEELPAPQLQEVEQILLSHLDALYEFYGDFLGVRIARKHVSWYLQYQNSDGDFRSRFNRLEGSTEQQHAVRQFFKDTIRKKELAA